MARAPRPRDAEAQKIGSGLRSDGLGGVVFYPSARHPTSRRPRDLGHPAPKVKKSQVS